MEIQVYFFVVGLLSVFRSLPSQDSGRRFAR
jgi:hypothetical protein